MTEYAERMMSFEHSSGAMGFPLIEVRGSDGPTLSIIAGVHGCEFPGMEACRRLLADTDLTSLRGRLRLVPVANLPAFFGRSEAVCPVDGKNLNRVFPGDLAGSYSEALAHHLFEEVVLGSDAVLDIHGGDIFEALVPYSGVAVDDGSEAARITRALARAYDLPFVVTFAEAASAQRKGMTLRDAAQAVGIPALLHESGGQGRMNEEFILTHLQGMRNTLYHLGMLPGEVVRRHDEEILVSDFWRAREEGMFYPLVQLRDRVKTGQVIGLVRDLFGKVTEEIVAPRDAWIIAIVTCFSCRKDGIVYQVAY